MKKPLNTILKKKLETEGFLRCPFSISEKIGRNISEFLQFDQKAIETFKEDQQIRKEHVTFFKDVFSVISKKKFKFFLEEMSTQTYKKIHSSEQLEQEKNNICKEFHKVIFATLYQIIQNNSLGEGGLKMENICYQRIHRIIDQYPFEQKEKMGSEEYEEKYYTINTVYSLQKEIKTNLTKILNICTKKEKLPINKEGIDFDKNAFLSWKKSHLIMLTFGATYDILTVLINLIKNGEIITICQYEKAKKSALEEIFYFALFSNNEQGHLIRTGIKPPQTVYGEYCSVKKENRVFTREGRLIFDRRKLTETNKKHIRTLPAIKKIHRGCLASYIGIQGEGNFLRHQIEYTFGVHQKNIFKQLNISLPQTH